MESEEWPNIICKIENFYSIKSIKSSCFSLRGDNCFLLLEQIEFKDTSQDYFSLRLQCSNATSVEKFSVYIFIKDDKFSQIHFRQRKDVNFRYNCENIEIWKVRRKEILDISGTRLICSKIMLSPISLVVIFGPFDYKILEESVQSPESHDTDAKENKMIQTALPIDNSSCLGALCRDFRNLLNDHIESDTTIKCEDCYFPVHKAILASRSEVFAAMFRNDMFEKRTGSITITDLSPSVLNELLHYIYTGTLDDLTCTDLTYGTALHLYSAAHKYAIVELQKRCSQFMVQNLSESNACKCLLLADICNDTEFKDSVISYIIDNKPILTSEEWVKICEDQMKLSNEVYREYVKKTS